jgi:hypothetical protein
MNETAQKALQETCKAASESSAELLSSMQKRYATLAELQQQNMTSWQAFSANFWQACASWQNSPTAMNKAMADFCQEMAKNAQTAASSWQAQAQELTTSYMQQTQRNQQRAAKAMQDATAIFSGTPATSKSTAKAASVTKIRTTAATSAAKNQTTTTSKSSKTKAS